MAEFINNNLFVIWLVGVILIIAVGSHFAPDKEDVLGRSDYLMDLVMFSLTWIITIPLILCAICLFGPIYLLEKFLRGL